MAIGVTVGSGGNKTVTGITVNNGGGNKTVIDGWVGTSGGNKQFLLPSLSASAPASATSAPGGTVAPASGGLLVTTSGGAAPLSIVWSKISGSNDPAISSTTAFAVSWSVTSPRDRTATWGYTVTDANSVQASGSVGVTFQTNF